MCIYMYAHISIYACLYIFSKFKYIVYKIYTYTYIYLCIYLYIVSFCKIVLIEK